MRYAVWLIVLGLVVTGCRPRELSPFDPRGLQRVQREHSAEVEPRPIPPLPDALPEPGPGAGVVPPPARTAEEPAAPEQEVRLPLQEVIRRAVVNNRDVRVAGYEPAIEETRVVEAESRYDPILFGNVGYEDRRRATPGTTFPDPFNPFAPPILIDRDDQRSIFGQVGVRQFLPAGGQVELSHRTARTTVRPQRFLIDPYYENELVLQITQPLLRDFGREINRARITIARQNQHISLLEFRQQLETSLSDIERTYWELALAERDLRILEHLLDRTQEMINVLEGRFGEADVTRLQLTQAYASLEQRRAALVRARGRIRDLSDQLKRLMNDPALPVAGEAVVLPEDVPALEPVRFDLADQIATAMENRPELAQQQLRIDSASLIARVARNNLLPALNVVASAGVHGIGEGAGDAFRDQREFDYPSYAIGLQLEIPIGNRAARAIHRRSLLQRQQAIEQYRNAIDLVALEVKTALNEVETSWRELVAARRARIRAAENEADFHDIRPDVPLTASFVQLTLDAQARLADAERSEAAAAANYNVAIVRLERAKGTLLRYNNVIMEERPAPFARARPADVR